MSEVELKEKSNDTKSMIYCKNIFIKTTPQHNSPKLNQLIIDITINQGNKIFVLCYIFCNKAALSYTYINCFLPLCYFKLRDVKNFIIAKQKREEKIKT